MWVAFVLCLGLVGASRSARLDELNKLLLCVVEKSVAEGAWVSHFELGASSSGLGVVASRDMAAGEVVVELPHPLHVNAAFAARFLPREVLESGVDPQVWVAVYLAMERFGALSRRKATLFESWWPWSKPVSSLCCFADLMPDHVANAAHWTAQEQREAMQMGPLGFVHDVNATWALLEGRVNLTQTQFLWGFSMLLSRSFKDMNGGAVLFPIADLFNHASNPNVVASMTQIAILSVDVTDPVAFTLLRNVSKGEELTISYGSGKANSELLQMYGFVMRDNPNDVLRLGLASTLVPRWKRDVLKSVLSIEALELENGGLTENCGAARFLDSIALKSSAEAAQMLLEKGGSCRASEFATVKQLCRGALNISLTKTRSRYLAPLFRETRVALQRCISNV